MSTTFKARLSDSAYNISIFFTFNSLRYAAGEVVAPLSLKKYTLVLSSIGWDNAAAVVIVELLLEVVTFALSPLAVTKVELLAIVPLILSICVVVVLPVLPSILADAGTARN